MPAEQIKLKTLFLVPQAEHLPDGKLTENGVQGTKTIATGLHNQGLTEVFSPDGTSPALHTAHILSTNVGLAVRKSSLFESQRPGESKEEFDKRTNAAIGEMDRSWMKNAVVVAPLEVLDSIARKAGNDIPLQEGRVYIITSDRKGKLTYGGQFAPAEKPTESTK